MTKYDLIIFDWDGTLMDSVARIISSMQAAAEKVGLSCPNSDDVKHIIGLSLPTALDKLFPSITVEQKEAMIVQYKYEYLEGDDTPTPLFANAFNLLTTLQQQSKLLAVATGKGREGLERVLAISETAHFFKTTRCASEMPSKPNPEMLNSILSELSIEPAKAVMIGDTSHDLEMAANAGVDSIGVTYGVHDSHVLSQFNPKAIVNSLAELETLLLNH